MESNMDKSDKTKICYGCMGKVPKSGICPCGWRYDYNQEERETLLAPGTLLSNGQYLIGRVLGRGGFGITYLGRQQDGLGLKIAIKEYFPKKLARRQMSSSPALLPRYQQGMTQAQQAVQQARYENGRNGFIEEARRLVTFNELPAIVSVLGYFEENNTAYIVMEYVDGIDLQHYMMQRGRTLNLQEVKQFIIPIAEDLYKVHQTGMIHRDISPDNIMVSRNGSVKLIDFGASVHQGEEEEVRVLRKNGFAPLEQYENSAENLGPWTDVYALCATMYMLLSGKILQDARDREVEDTFQTLKSMNIMVPRRMDRLIKKGLSLNWRKRFRSMKELAGQLKRVRSNWHLWSWTGAGIGLVAGISAFFVGYFFLYWQKPQIRQTSVEFYAASVMDEADRQESETEKSFAASAAAYAVYDDLVYIRYVFENGAIMLVRSPVGTDDFSQVEYVTDGDFEHFCVYDGYLYWIGLQDHCIYRANLSEMEQREAEGRSIEGLKEAGILEKISGTLEYTQHGFYIEDGYLYLMEEDGGVFELRRMSVDGREQYGTSLDLCLTNYLFCGGFVFFTTKEAQETVLWRMRLDGCYYEELNRYSGDIPAMVPSGDKLYYLVNGEEEGYLGCIGFNGAESSILVRKNNQDLQYCSMTGIVDDNHIYYTCSIEGSEVLNNLYCYSIKEGSNRQISSECGRYIATSDEIPYIIFASMDGSEIRQMNKDGSNPRVMRETDGSSGVLEKVDITSLEIIRNHVYYLDGDNVAYKEIESEEL